MLLLMSMIAGSFSANIGYRLSISKPNSGWNKKVCYCNRSACESAARSNTAAGLSAYCDPTYECGC